MRFAYKYSTSKDLIYHNLKYSNLSYLRKYKIKYLCHISLYVILTLKFYFKKNNSFAKLNNIFQILYFKTNNKSYLIFYNQQ